MDNVPFAISCSFLQRKIWEKQVCPKDHGSILLYLTISNRIEKVKGISNKNDDLLVVLGFNATLTAKVVSWQLVMNMCFLAFSHQYYNNFSFKSHRQLFSHASAAVRGENTLGKKVCRNRGSNSQPPGHKSDTLTTEPPGRGTKTMNSSYF